MRSITISLMAIILCTGFLFFAGSKKVHLSPIEQLGKKIFFDENLSSPPGQSCATCHGPEVGWSGPDSEINKKWAVYHGAKLSRFGNRKPPSAAYSGMNPRLHQDEEEAFSGGIFWDGRATGWEHDDPLAEQAMGPFLNPLEQNLPDKQSIIKKIQKSSYAHLFKKVWGKDSISLDDVDRTYVRIARSIAAFERSKEVNPFSSKFDLLWKLVKDKGIKVENINESNMKTFKGLGLDDEEVMGLMLFNTKGKCSQCHPLTSENNLPPLFTDFTYDNLGIPRNPNNPFYKMDKEWNPEGKNWVDKGLGGFLESTVKYKKFAHENFGKHKVPTLRNVDLRPSKDFVKAFMHNGFFKTLEDVVHFYNTRDKQNAQWPEPEIKVNINRDELGNLKLTSREEKAIVLFMKTLSDR